MAAFGSSFDDWSNAYRLAADQLSQDAYNPQAFLGRLGVTANTSGTAVAGVSTMYPDTCTLVVGQQQQQPMPRAESSNVAWLNRRVDDLRVRL